MYQILAWSTICCMWRVEKVKSIEYKYSYELLHKCPFCIQSEK
jgi:hypothetical protein